LAELCVPPAVISAGLLHDTVEDTDLTLKDIRRDFGDEIALLVDGVTKLTQLPRVSRGDQHSNEQVEEDKIRELAERLRNITENFSCDGGRYQSSLD
jgi:GTP pyrophosphokinase